MKVRCRWTVVCALLVTAGAMRPSSGSAGKAAESRAVTSTTTWSQRAQRFDELWRGSEQEQAEGEILAEGREAARTGLRRVVKELPGSDPRRVQAGFALYVLDPDRTLGRSVLIGVCRADRRPRPWEDALALVAMAYEHRPDGELLSAALDVVPRIDGASAEVMSHFVRDVAKERTRDLLTALWEKPNGLRQSVAGFLTGGLDDRPARQAYAEVARIADRADDPLRSRADELLREVDRQQASIAQQRRRQEQRKDQQFPMVPEGVALPTSALKALQARYPHWHILATHGFDDRVVSAVHNRFGTAAGPQHVWGDFDGNGLRDVALLMRPNGPGEVKLIALRQWKADRWAADELSSFPFSSGFQGGYSGFTIYITPRAPGEVAYWTEQGKSGRLDLKHDGVERNFHGKASMLYYWTRSAWATVQTGD